MIKHLNHFSSINISRAITYINLYPIKTITILRWAGSGNEAIEFIAFELFRRQKFQCLKQILIPEYSTYHLCTTWPSTELLRRCPHYISANNCFCIAFHCRSLYSGRIYYERFCYSTHTDTPREHSRRDISAMVRPILIIANYLWLLQLKR